MHLQICEPVISKNTLGSLGIKKYSAFMAQMIVKEVVEFAFVTMAWRKIECHPSICFWLVQYHWGIDRNMCVIDAIYIHCIQCFQSIHCLLELCTIQDANACIQKNNSYQNSYEATIQYKITVTLIGFHQCIVLLLRFDLTSSDTVSNMFRLYLST